MKNPKGIERLVRRGLLSLEPYEPIVPLEALSARSGLPVGRLIKLDGNENPYGCSPRVQRALADYSSYHIYPDPLHRELREALEGYVRLGMEHIAVGSGSDELIDLVLRLFLELGDRVITCVPTFGMYRFNTQVCGGEMVEVPRDGSYEVDVAAVKRAIDGRAKLIFLASPNNPTGNIAPERDVLELVDTGLGVLVDEAYYEFGKATVASHVPQYDNLMVIRSFSKWAGLAGLRVGYGLFPVRIADLLYKVKPPYNVNVAAQIAVRESLADLPYLQDRVEAIIKERERLFSRLKGQGLLEPFPSRANFLLCSAPQGRAQGIKEGLERKGIFIRYFDTPLLRDKVRISVGRPEHTEALLQALEALKKEGEGHG